MQEAASDKESKRGRKRPIANRGQIGFAAVHTSQPEGLPIRKQPHALTSSDVMHLQRAIGNRAVNKMLGGSGPSQVIQPKRRAEGKSAQPQPMQVTPQSQPTIQRVVQSRLLPLTKGGFLTQYYSTYDPKTSFETEKEAWEYDSKLAGESTKEFDPFTRYPTNYSYYQTDSRNVPKAEQGPHTLSHVSISHRLNKRLKEDGGTGRMWKSQVLGKKKFGKYLKGEAPSTFKPAQKKRMKNDYRIMHQRLKFLLKDNPEYSTNKHELMMRLMQMNPYTVYGKGKMSQKALKHKGERADKPFDEAFDTRATFNIAKRYQKYGQMRKAMYSEKDEAKL